MPKQLKKGILEGIEKELKAQTAWHTKHQKEDTKEFTTLKKALANLPTKDDIVKTLGDTVDVKINGKLIGLKEHLDRQDETMAIAATERASFQTTLEELSAKIRPLDSARTWAGDLGKVILYVGGLAAAIAAIVYVTTLFGLYPH